LILSIAELISYSCSLSEACEELEYKLTDCGTGATGGMIGAAEGGTKLGVAAGTRLVEGIEGGKTVLGPIEGANKLSFPILKSFGAEVVIDVVETGKVSNASKPVDAVGAAVVAAVTEGTEEGVKAAADAGFKLMAGGIAKAVVANESDGGMTWTGVTVGRAADTGGTSIGGTAGACCKKYINTGGMVGGNG
jgi:hypothetical protein